MSSVNISEIATILNNIEFSIDETKELIGNLVKKTIGFDDQQAYIAAEMRNQIKKLGLSFGDRACLSLATLKKLPVLTTDKTWSKLNVDFDIIIIW